MKLAVVLGVLAFVALTPRFFSREPACPGPAHRFEVRGRSMVPLFIPGAQVYLHEDEGRCRPPRVGDVVAVRGANAPRLKAVRARPGMRLRFDGGFIWVEGRRIINAYGSPLVISPLDAERLEASLVEGRVPAGAYLVLGQQVSNSLDSRRVGLVTQRDLVGRLDPDAQQ